MTGSTSAGTWEKSGGDATDKADGVVLELEANGESAAGQPALEVLWTGIAACREAASTCDKGTATGPPTKGYRWPLGPLAGTAPKKLATGGRKVQSVWLLPVGKV